MGAPEGNQNAAKAKKWSAAIERAIATWPNPPSDEGKAPFMVGMDKAAHEFVKKMMLDADLGFFKEFGDRLDGKPAQTIAGDADNPLTLKYEKIVREIVDPHNTNA